MPEIPPAPAIETRSAKWVWIIPLVAALAGLVLVWQHYQRLGIPVVVRFKTATGLEAGKTAVRFKDVDVGKVESVSLTEDLQHVAVRLRIDRVFIPHLRERTRFWVVRPRIDQSGISGFSTLLSGAYIAMEPGEGELSESFTGLEQPPVTSSDTPGIRIRLQAERAGSIDVGTPIYYRSAKVGTVETKRFTDDQQRIIIDAFVKAPFHRQITEASRFWNASGVKMTLDANGIRVKAQSLETLLSGGIVFDNPDPEAPPVEDGAGFLLYASESAIHQVSFDGDPIYVMYFDSSVRGAVSGRARRLPRCPDRRSPEHRPLPRSRHRRREDSRSGGHRPPAPCRQEDGGPQGPLRTTCQKGASGQS